MKILLLSVLCMLSGAAFAGPVVIGNGGDGVYIDGGFYLLDLVEVGNHQNPYIGDSRSSTKTEQILAASLGSIPVDLQLMSRKVQDVAKLSGGLATAIVRAIQVYNWQLVSYDLANVDDEDTVVNLPLHQIAVRKKDQILVNKRLFSELDPKNQIALIFHEAVYALIKPLVVYHGHREESWQPSFDARRNNQYLFRANATFDGVVKTAEKFGDPTHKFLPATGPVGIVADIRDGHYSIDQSVEVYSRHEGFMDSLGFSASSENKATSSVIDLTCKPMKIPRKNDSPVVELRFFYSNRMVSIMPGVLSHEGSYLNWTINELVGRDVSVPVKGTQSACKATLIQYLRKIGAY